MIKFCIPQPYNLWKVPSYAPVHETNNMDNVNPKELVGHVIGLVCKEMCVSPLNLKSTSRKQEYVDARAMCFKFLYQITPHYTLKKVGALFGKHHATVMHGILSCDDLFKTNRVFRFHYKQVEKSIADYLKKVE